MNNELEKWIDEMIDEIEPIDLDIIALFDDSILEELFNSL